MTYDRSTALNHICIWFKIIVYRRNQLTNYVCKTPPIYAIYHFDLFFHAISYSICVGARLILLWFTFLLIMDLQDICWFLEQMNILLFIFFPLQFAALFIKIN